MPEYVLRLLGHLSSMATESKRFKYEPIPGVIELSREEIAQSWMKRLPVNMEQFYVELSSKDEGARKRWADAVKTHPFELDREAQLARFDAILDLHDVSQEDLDLRKRELLIDVIEHHGRPLADALQQPAETLMLSVIDAAKSMRVTTVHDMRSQVHELIIDAARNAGDAEKALAQRVAEQVVPEVVMYIMLTQEQKRRENTQEFGAFGPEQMDWLRENPNLVRMQTRMIDPELATITEVNEKTVFPPKESTYVLNWLREVGDDYTPEAMRDAIQKTFPKEAFTDMQKRAALERVLQLVEGYPQSLLVPQDAGFESERESDGRAKRIFIQLRKAIREDATIIPKLRPRDLEYTREQDRAANTYNHDIAKYTQQTLPKFTAELVKEYDTFLQTEDMAHTIESARRLAYCLSERYLELAGIDEDMDGEPELPNLSDIEPRVTAAARRALSFLESVYRTKNRNSNNLSTFINAIHDDVARLMDARIRQASLAVAIEQANRSIASREVSDADLPMRQREIDRMRLDMAIIARKLARYKEGDPNA